MIINLSFVLLTGADDSCVLLHTNLQTTPTGHDRCKIREAGEERRRTGVKKVRFSFINFSVLFCISTSTLIHTVIRRK